MVSKVLNVFFGTRNTSILIDFGRVDNQTNEGNFNNVYGTGTGLDTPSVALIDSEGADTGITLNADFSSGGSWSGKGADYPGPYPEAVADQPFTAIQDSMFIRSPAFSTFTLTGLEPGVPLDILIYGARSNNGGPNAEWTFTDNSGDQTLAFDVFNNDNEIALFEDLIPDANNELVLNYTSTDDGSRPRGAMSFMQIFVGGASDETPLEITSIALDRKGENPTYTITWNSTPGTEYALSFSTDLEVWEEITDGISSGGSTTVYGHKLQPAHSELIDAPRVFYRVELVE